MKRFLRLVSCDVLIQEVPNLILVLTDVLVLQRVDCINRQCNATQETTTSESCQRCEDLEKCYNYVVRLLFHDFLVDSIVVIDSRSRDVGVQH